MPNDINTAGHKARTSGLHRIQHLFDGDRATTEQRRTVTVYLVRQAAEVDEAHEELHAQKVVAA